MSGDGLCRRGLHAWGGEGPCERCRAAGKRLCAKGLHDLDAEGATYTEKDGRTRCAECRRARRQKARRKAKRRRAEEARGVAEDAPPVEEAPTIAVWPRGVGRAEAARYRHDVMVRRSRGLM